MARVSLKIILYDKNITERYILLNFVFFLKITFPNDNYIFTNEYFFKYNTEWKLLQKYETCFDILRCNLWDTLPTKFHNDESDLNGSKYFDCWTCKYVL